MPSRIPPPLRRAMQSGVTKEEHKTLPPPLQRVTKINKAADKYKWSK